MISFLKKYKWIFIGVALAAIVLIIAFISGGNVEEAKKLSEQRSISASFDSPQGSDHSVNEVIEDNNQKTANIENSVSTDETTTSSTPQTSFVNDQTDPSVSYTTQGTTSAQKSSPKEEKPNEKPSTPAETVPKTKPQEQNPVDENTRNSSKKHCTISISCATLLDNMDKLDEEYHELVPDDGWILKSTTVTITGGDTVFDVLKRVCRSKKIHMEFTNNPIYNSAYIEGIGNLSEFSAGPNSGWMYRVNGWFPNYGCSQYEVKNGDVIEWMYTCNLGYDIGGGNARGSD